MTRARLAEDMATAVVLAQCYGLRSAVVETGRDHPVSDL